MYDLMIGDDDGGDGDGDDNDENSLAVQNCTIPTHVNPSCTPTKSVEALKR